MEDDAKCIAVARVEIDKVRNWRDPRRKDRISKEYVLLPLAVAERLLTLATKYLAERGGVDESAKPGP
jgi:hypothetical protein